MESTRHAEPKGSAGFQPAGSASILARRAAFWRQDCRPNPQPGWLRHRVRQALHCAALAAFLLVGCSSKEEPPAQRAEAAQQLFDHTIRDLHNASTGAPDHERLKLQTQAAANYRELLRRYPEQSNLCAQALRQLGNIHAAQTNLKEAVKCYAQVGQRYAQEDWEVLQAWKSAADLLWEADRHDEARDFYRRIVTQFDGTNQPPVVRLVVKGSQTRLNGGKTNLGQDRAW